MSEFERQYGTAATINIPLFKAGTDTYATSADWTPAAGDVKVSKDEGAAANITTLPTAITMGGIAYWKFQLSVSEMTAARVVVIVDDAAIADDGFAVVTFGNASAQFPDSTVSANVVQVSGDSTAADNLEAAYDGTGYLNGGTVHRYGTVAAATSTTVTLASGASSTDDFYNGCLILIDSGPGSDVFQPRTITDYVGSTKVATLQTAWTTTPTTASTYRLSADT